MPNRPNCASRSSLHDMGPRQDERRAELRKDVDGASPIGRSTPKKASMRSADVTGDSPRTRVHSSATLRRQRLAQPDDRRVDGRHCAQRLVVPELRGCLLEAGRIRARPLLA
jgi:hypothetical protein